ncbi:threonine-phosphate decarboxylase CobD [Natrialbaceae archaeon AArc-T1-2]|uniref:threonine-phosphate decarboxylase CobD n=1 Tax=Natrialbaceae archaeon AArc-T1-2 TaxID=3053904 RepID=UPI00255AF443|nr:threonine-phosphate decarboxylase CobD [Natrialbaceae archaeon AArc-T1-2]WIV68651.1 threonine-phosphate decarboxylase CobD [Natrialbaceae archaeon AArc-T1-2]
MEPDAIRSAERVPHGGETDPSVLDFSANINPRVPAGVDAVYADALEASRRYPDDDYPDYRRAAADYVGCEPEAVIPTPGGLAAIRLALETILEPGDDVLVPYPSFGEYAREVRLQGASPRFVRHDDLLDADPAPYAVAIVCTPNNPTGEAADPGRLAAFADRCLEAGTTLLVDEAFLGFTDHASMAGREGVVVARSLTKLFGLPGLRAGFAVATGDRRDDLAVSRPAWNLGTPAARVGAHCLRQDGFVYETRKRVARERKRMRDALEAAGFDVHPSDAPYLLCAVDGDVDALLADAREQGIALRDARTFRGLDAHVRVAVNDRAANDRLLEVLCDGRP